MLAQTRHRCYSAFVFAAGVVGTAAFTTGCSQAAQYVEQDKSAAAPAEVAPLSRRYVSPEHALPQNTDFNDSLKHVAMAEPAASASVLPVPALAIGATPAQPHLVKSVEIHLQADDVRAQSAALQSLTTEMGGYLSALNEDSNTLDRTVIQLTLRIPAQQLDEAMKRIEALGKVIQRSLTTQDVTLQFVDMQSRLRNLEKTEARLLAHLEQSGPMEAILTVEKEIDRVRGEVETLQGRINDLGNQIGYATVRVTLSATPTAGPITPAAAFSTSATFTDALRNLGGFAQGVWYIVIWVLVWVPVWVPLAFFARYLYRRSAEANSSTS